jgi:hypothetical protein
MFQDAFLLFFGVLIRKKVQKLTKVLKIKKKYYYTDIYQGFPRCLARMLKDYHPMKTRVN